MWREELAIYNHTMKYKLKVDKCTKQNFSWLIGPVVLGGFLVVALDDIHAFILCIYLVI